MPIALKPTTATLLLYANPSSRHISCSSPALLVPAGGVASSAAFASFSGTVSAFPGLLGAFSDTIVYDLQVFVVVLFELISNGKGCNGIGWRMIMDLWERREDEGECD